MSVESRSLSEGERCRSFRHRRLTTCQSSWGRGIEVVVVSEESLPGKCRWTEPHTYAPGEVAVERLDAGLCHYPKVATVLGRFQRQCGRELGLDLFDDFLDYLDFFDDFLLNRYFLDLFNDFRLNLNWYLL